MMPWGAENMTVPERYKRTLEAGVNLYSGTADPTILLETVKKGMVDIKLIDDSVLRLLEEKFRLGLFENPYVDADAAGRIVGNAKFQTRANLALRKSIVLLRNEAKTLPLKAKTKVYFETYQKRIGAETGPGDVFSTNEDKYPVTFGTTTDALLDIVTGKFRPTGKLPFTTPISEAAAQQQKEDVSGYLEGSAYPLFKYNEGMNY